MQKLIYLSTGQQAYLVETLPSGKFLVDPVFTYQDHEGNYFDSEGRAYEVVDAIFNKPPVAKISDEVKQLQDKLLSTKQGVLDAQKELNEVNFQLGKAKQESQDLAKWRVDLSRFKTCKSISFFLEGDLLPVTTKKPTYQSDYYILKFQIDIHKGEQTQKIVQYYSDGYDMGRDKKIDESIGFIFDATREELDALIIDRISKTDFSNYSNLSYLHNIPTVYANEAMNKRMDELEARQKENNRANIEKQIEDLQKRLSEIS